MTHPIKALRNCIKIKQGSLWVICGHSGSFGIIQACLGLFGLVWARLFGLVHLGSFDYAHSFWAHWRSLGVVQGHSVIH